MPRRMRRSYTRAPPRRRRARFPTWRRHFRRHKDRHIPIIATIGGVGSIFASRDDQHMSLGAWFTNTLSGQSPNLMEPTNLMNAAADGIAQYVGYDFRNGSWGIPRGLLVALGGMAGSMIMGKVGANKVLAKLPFVGKYVKW